MITDDRLTEIFCVVDKFCKNLTSRWTKSLSCPQTAKFVATARFLSDSEIMAILIVFHFGSFHNFKHYYLLLPQFGTRMSKTTYAVLELGFNLQRNTS